jgi:hypothetical protein
MSQDTVQTTTVKQVAISVVDGAIQVKPDPVKVTQVDTLVVFTLVTDGYHFPADDAIVLDTPHSDFPYAAWTTKPQQAALFDQRCGVGDYAYTITVIDTATGRVITLDPVIHNTLPTEMELVAA